MRKELREEAERLVKEHSSASYIRQLILNKYGKTLSLKKIAALRGVYLRSDPNYKRSSHNAKPLPDDFAQVAPTMTKTQLQRHYGVLWSGTIDRWLQEAGVSARRFVPQRNRLSQMGRVKATPKFERHRDEYEIAADTLRRERFPVNRCNQDGGFNVTGKYWRVGRTVLTNEELIEKAKRYG
jgi:hypothetical protein